MAYASKLSWVDCGYNFAWLFLVAADFRRVDLYGLVQPEKLSYDSAKADDANCPTIAYSGPLCLTSIEMWNLVILAT